MVNHNSFAVVRSFCTIPKIIIVYEKSRKKAFSLIILTASEFRLVWQYVFSFRFLSAAMHVH